MIHHDKYNIFDFAIGISRALDLVNPILSHHHRRVAYIAYSLARELRWNEHEILDLVIAAILHDIGAFSRKEHILIGDGTEFKNIDPCQHAYIGYLLLRTFEPLCPAAKMIRYHHTSYKPGQSGIPRGSYIICLADWVARQIHKDTDILQQSDQIAEQIKQEAFLPEAVEAFLRLAQREYFWVETGSDFVYSILASRINTSRNIEDLDLLYSFAKTMSLIIDFRSRFTATHSSGVAAVALELTRLLEFSKQECLMVHIAGHLHDLGKLSVTSEILDKSGKLDYSEMNIVRKHTYYTYQILSQIRGLEDVATWASCHHERLDGNGYPFHIAGDELTKLSRIMAVADVFTAITEDRPYRDGMAPDQAMAVLESMVGQAIDSGIVAIVKEHFGGINEKRIKAQNEAMREYKEFSRQMEEYKKCC